MIWIRSVLEQSVLRRRQVQSEFSAGNITAQCRFNFSVKSVLNPEKSRAGNQLSNFQNCLYGCPLNLKLLCRRQYFCFEAHPTPTAWRYRYMDWKKFLGNLKCIICIIHCLTRKLVSEWNITLLQRGCFDIFSLTFYSCSLFFLYNGKKELQWTSW